MIGIGVDEHAFPATQCASAVELRVREDEPAETADRGVWVVLVPLGQWDESGNGGYGNHSHHLR